MFINIIFWIFIAAGVLQCIFYLSSFIRVAMHKQSDKQNKEQLHEGISIVISARNEMENLPDLIQSLLLQEHPVFEIIIINDRSVDGSYEYLIEEQQKHEHFRFINIDESPDHIDAKKYALMLGVKGAKYNTVLLTDADCTPKSKQWAIQMHSAFKKDTQIVLGYSQYAKEQSILNDLIRYETLYTALQYLGAAKANNAYMGVGRNMAYKRDFFLANKGFAEFKTVIGGDDDLFVNKYANSKNTQIAIGEHAITYSIPSKTWAEFFRQKKRHLTVGKEYRFKNKFKLGLLFLSHLLFWVTFCILAVNNFEIYWVLGSLGLRIVLQYLVIGYANKNLGDNFKIIFIPFLDLIYLGYYSLMGLTVLFTKQTKWN